MSDFPIYSRADPIVIWVDEDGDDYTAPESPVAVNPPPSPPPPRRSRPPRRQPIQWSTALDPQNELDLKIMKAERIVKRLEREEKRNKKTNREAEFQRKMRILRSMR